MRNFTEIFQLLTPPVSEISILARIPGVSIGIVHENEVVFRHNYGFLNLLNQVPTTSDTIYPIGSLTKGFTAATIASLVEDGILDWSSPIKQIPPDLRTRWSEINEMTSILDLLSMRTGLSSADSVWFNAPPVLISSQIMQVFNSLPQAKSFRSTMQYNNLGYALAACVVQHRTGESLSLNLEQRIFVPLGMSSTGFDIAKLASSQISKTYVVMKDGTPEQFTRSLMDGGSWIAACGGLRSSVNDLLIYYKSLLQSAKSQFKDGTTSDQYSPLKQATMLLTGYIFLGNPQRSLRERSYGMGWVRTQLPGILGAVGYNEYFVNKMPVAGTGSAPWLAVYQQGNLPSASSAVYMFPETGSAVVVLCNAFGLTDAPDWIAQLFVEKLFDDSTDADYVLLAREAIQRTLEGGDNLEQELSSLQISHTSPQDLIPFVGRYHNLIGPFFLDINLTGGQLSVSFQGLDLETYPLTHSHENAFCWYTSSDDLTRRGRHPMWFKPSYFLLSFDPHNSSLVWENDSNFKDGNLFSKGTKQLESKLNLFAEKYRSSVFIALLVAAVGTFFAYQGF